MANVTTTTIATVNITATVYRGCLGYANVVSYGIVFIFGLNRFNLVIWIVYILFLMVIVNITAT